VLSSSASLIGSRRYRNHRNLNAPKYYEEVIRLSEQDEYIELSRLASTTGVRYSSDKELLEYRGVLRLSGLYESIFSDLMVNLTDTAISDSRLSGLSSNLYYFYKSFADYSDYGKDNEKVQKFNEDIKRDMRILLITYMGISDETADKLETMTEGQLAVMVEEAYK